MRPWGWRGLLTALLGRLRRSGHLLGRLPVEPGQRVLVLGGAEPDLLLAVALLVGPTGMVKVVDPDWRLLMEARRHARRQGVGGVVFRQMSPDRLTDGAGRYDLVYSVSPPGAPWPRVLAEAARVLRPHGVCSVTLRLAGPAGCWPRLAPGRACGRSAATAASGITR
jgi:ubiquinone/menaquinone biosynthesis C-methylase UbiE